MTNHLKLALDILKAGDYTCVMTDGSETVTSKERGVHPLIKLYDSKKDFSSFSAADKVVGKAAAMVYVLLGVKEIYSLVISDVAAEVFSRNGIDFYYEKKVPRIFNRTNTGFCPMEEAVKDIDNPYDGLDAVREKLKALNNQ